MRIDKGNLRLRASLLRAVRNFFDGKGFIEVETDVAIKAPAPEEYIEAVQLENGLYLRTSPELEMKMLLAEGMDRIYQIGRCFRAGEYGSCHRGEFTMLEYYAVSFDYLRLAHLTSELLRAVTLSVKGSTSFACRGVLCDMSAEVELLTVAQAYEKYAAMTVAEAEERGLFDELMVTKIEPKLGQGHLTFLIDYPADRAALARLKKDEPGVAERWELYLCGVELANAFGELTSANEQKRRFAQAAAFRRDHGMHGYPLPEDFYLALDKGLPESSGCALGLDRLAMLLADADDIGAVRAE